MNEAFFVYLSTVVFIILLWKFDIFKNIAFFLEKKCEEIRLRLFQTDVMRKEAEVLYDEYRLKMEMLEHEASEIIATAKKTADAILEETEANIRLISERKKQELESRISDYERSIKEDLVQKYAYILINILEDHGYKDLPVLKLDLTEIKRFL